MGNSNTNKTNDDVSVEDKDESIAVVQKNSKIDELRSDEVQEILNHVPSWMIRWGITLIFGLIAMLLFLSWLIQYPDVISGSIILTTEIPPVKLVSKTSGQIHKIYVHQGDYVREGDFIAEIQAEYNSLKSSVKEYELLLTDNFRENKILNLKRQLQYYRG